MQRWILGLDGGGTKTTLALVDRDGAMIGPLQAHGINPFDQPQWKSVLAGLLTKVADMKEQVAHACFGVPGYGEVEETSTAQESAVAAWAEAVPTTIMNDVAVACVGAFQDHPGILILAGTGSMVWGYDERHAHIRVGGWGELIGDEGSAYWVGMEALRQLTWTMDGRLRDAEFLQSLQQATCTRDGDELLRWCYSLEHLRSRIAGLAPAVSQLAEAGNLTAYRILEEAAALLWAQAQAAREQASFNSPVTYSYAGGMFRNSILRSLVKEHAEAEGRWSEPALPPLGGALWQAAKEAGWEPSSEWVQGVKKGLQEVETK